ncbi:phage tail protein [Pseudomonas sp. NR3]|uniref:phage tail protein n=1 Tax=Pseudomonas sp. NR3 TaxID=3155978 RepID=UPI003B67BD03
MTDQNSQFFTILTAIGKAKQANANALGVAWTFAQMGVGDANGTDPIPSEQQTRLINERRRAPLNQLKVDPANPNIIIAEQVIPEHVGGWWIREVGLYDADGDMVAVANCAPSFKPLLTQGSGRTQVVRMNLIVSSTANVDLKIDPSVVLATRQYVDMNVQDITHGFARLLSPNFTGTPKAPTPPQPDNTTALATTEFVQRGMGNYRGFINATRSLTLTADSIGAVVTCVGTFTVKLPPAGDSRSGSAVHVRNNGSGTITVACAGADTINTGSGQVKSMVLDPGTNLELIGNGALSWWASGSAQLGYSDIFSGQYSPAGFQKWPNRFIEQWMQVALSASGTSTITYPHTLSAVYGVHPVVIFGGAHYGVSVDGTPGLSSCGLRASTAAPLHVFVRIIGKR